GQWHARRTAGLQSEPAAQLESAGLRRRSPTHQYVPIPFFTGADVLMTTRPSLAFWFTLALLARAETLDRIAVTVGRHVISERDIIEDLRLSAFLDGKAPDFGEEQKRKSAERLIDQYLVLEDAAATRAALPSPEDAAPLLAS